MPHAMLLHILNETNLIVFEIYHKFAQIKY